jgi:hypothetical protein
MATDESAPRDSQSPNVGDDRGRRVPSHIQARVSSHADKRPAGYRGFGRANQVGGASRRQALPRKLFSETIIRNRAMSLQRQCRGVVRATRPKRELETLVPVLKQARSITMNAWSSGSETAPAPEIAFITSCNTASACSPRRTSRSRKPTCFPGAAGSGPLTAAEAPLACFLSSASPTSAHSPTPARTHPPTLLSVQV